MPQYDNNLRGALFRAKEKRTERSPDYTGQCEIEGVEYWISAWIEEAKNGQKYFSLAFNEKEERRPSRSSSRHERQKADGYQQEEFPDDDVPF